MSIPITYVQDTITSYLDNRFLTGFIVSVQPLFNSVFRVTFLLPKSDHVTVLELFPGFSIIYLYVICMNLPHSYLSGRCPPWFSLL